MSVDKVDTFLPKEKNGSNYYSKATRKCKLRGSKQKLWQGHNEPTFQVTLKRLTLSE